MYPMIKCMLQTYPSNHKHTCLKHNLISHNGIVQLHDAACCGRISVQRRGFEQTVEQTAAIRYLDAHLVDHGN